MLSKVSPWDPLCTEAETPNPENLLRAPKLVLHGKFNLHAAFVKFVRPAGLMSTKHSQRRHPATFSFGSAFCNCSFICVRPKSCSGVR